MKSHHLFLGIFCCFILFACNKDNDCDGTFVIESVVPDSNPPGTEIKIKGTGFSKDTEVRFAGQLAKSDFSNEKGLVATIPSNVIGFVDLTVEEGDCLARTDFEVLGALPINWVASPTVIIIPTLPQNFPSNISNVWQNYYDTNHSLTLVQFDDCFGLNEAELSPSSCIESHATNPFLNNNPIAGVYQCVDERIISLEIDRRKKGAGIDILEGSVIEPESIGEDDSDGKGYMLLTSKNTGRQYVFFRN
ncbi:MAG: IPT/TIG domain-containing protein [Saprospiraceae bacterium]|nr:IPT/TIG domain-containing protein [Saprospiraceae bacterium]